MIKAKVKVKLRRVEPTRIIVRKMQPTMNSFCRGFVKILKSKLSTPFPPASRPYAIPHMRTGNLRRSIRYAKLNMKKYVIKAGGIIAPYAVDVEYGDGFVAPRPFMRPAMYQITRYFHSKYYIKR